MVIGIFVPSNSEAELEFREFNALSDYQLAVGGFIEPVDIAALGITVYLNGEGLLRQLPWNSRVTLLWRSHSPEAQRGSTLVGDAVIVGAPDASGAATEIPRAAQRFLATMWLRP